MSNFSTRTKHLACLCTAGMLLCGSALAASIPVKMVVYESTTSRIMGGYHASLIKWDAAKGAFTESIDVPSTDGNCLTWDSSGLQNPKSFEVTLPDESGTWYLYVNNGEDPMCPAPPSEDAHEMPLMLKSIHGWRSVKPISADWPGQSMLCLSHGVTRDCPAATISGQPSNILPGASSFSDSDTPSS